MALALVCDDRWNKSSAVPVEDTDGSLTVSWCKDESVRASTWTLSPGVGLLLGGGESTADGFLAE